MNRQRSGVILFGCISVGLLLFLTLLAARPQPTIAQKTCSTDPEIVAELPEVGRRQCEEHLAALKIQVDAREAARIEAAPRVVLPIPTLSPEYIKEYGTPVPPGVVPSAAMIAKEIPPENRVDGPQATRPDAAISAWVAGVVLDSRKQTYSTLYVYTTSQVCGIGIDTTAISKQFINDLYMCPDKKDMRLVITAIDLKTYIVSLKDQDGRAGTFDLLNHTWVLP